MNGIEQRALADPSGEIDRSVSRRNASWATIWWLACIDFCGSRVCMDCFGFGGVFCTPESARNAFSNCVPDYFCY